MKKKFLFLIEADLTSGASRCGLELINELKRDSNFTPVVVTQHKSDFNKACEKLDVENYYLHYARICSLGMGIFGHIIAYIMRPILNFIALQRLKKKIDLNTISFVHSNGSSIDFGAYLQKKFKLPHLWHVRDFFLFEGKWPPLVKDFPKYLERHSSKVITVSNALRNYLIIQGCNSSKIETVYDGIKSVSCLEHKTNSPHEKDILKVVCVGQICEAKGQKTLIEAISLLPNELRKHFKFDFYGDFIDSEEISISKIVNTNKLSDIVEFKGYSKNILYELGKYDIGIQPSHSEGFSRVTAEYMFAGLCVVAADEGAIPELIQDNESGLLYEDYNAQQLAQKITYCYENPEQVYKLGQHAKNRAENLYTLKTNLKKILDLYNNLN